MDLSNRAQSRIYWQYRGADKLREWVDTLPAIAQNELENPALLVADILNIDERSGEQLDIIGRIVGLERPRIVSISNENITTFANDAELSQMGDFDAQFTPVSFFSKSETSDELFRVLIKAKIIKNNEVASIDDVVRAIRLATSAETITINDYQNMTFDAVFDEVLSSEARFALKEFDIAPRPQGVEFLGFIENPLYTQFGDAQMGDFNAQCNEVYS